MTGTGHDPAGRSEGGAGSPSGEVLAGHEPGRWARHAQRPRLRRGAAALLGAALLAGSAAAMPRVKDGLRDRAAADAVSVDVAYAGALTAVFRSQRPAGGPERDEVDVPLRLTNTGERPLRLVRAHLAGAEAADDGDRAVRVPDRAVLPPGDSLVVVRAQATCAEVARGVALVLQAPTGREVAVTMDEQAQDDLSRGLRRSGCGRAG